MSLNAMLTLIELATRESQRAAETLSDANRLLKEGEKTLTLLLDYRQDYAQQLSQHAQQGLAAESYQNFQLFLQKLDQAIVNQQAVVATCREKTAIQLRYWQSCERKKLSYGVIVDQAEHRVRQQQQKQEQKVTDEHAQRQSTRQRSGSPRRDQENS